MKLNGIKEIPCKIGEKYNSKIHEIIKKINDNSYESNIVAEIFEEGYYIND